MTCRNDGVKKANLMEIFLGWGGQIAKGVTVTVEVAALALVLGLLWGILAALAKLSSSAILRWAGNAYTGIIRGIPELLVIFIIYFGGTVTLSALNQRLFNGGYVEISALAAGVFALSLVFGAYAAENIRGAITVIPRGQIEAAHAMGMSRWTTFYHIKLPLMWRYALPGLGNNWVSLLKDTSLISIIGLEEIMRISALAISSTHQPFRFYFIAAIIYLLLTFINTVGLHWLERRVSRGERRINR